MALTKPNNTGDSIRASNVTDNKGNEINISSIQSSSSLYYSNFLGIEDYINMPYQVTWNWCSIGNNTRPTVVDMMNYASEIALTNDYSIVSPLIDYLGEQHTEEEIQSDDYIMKRQQFIDSVYFIWGNIDDGGLFVCKAANYSAATPTIRLCMVGGVYEHTEINGSDVIKTYYHDIGYQNISYANMVINSKFCFFWDGESDNKRICFLYDVPSNSAYGDDNWQVCMPETGQSGVSSWSSEISTGNIIDYIETADFNLTSEWYTVGGIGGSLFNTIAPSIIFRTYGGEADHNSLIGFNTIIETSDVLISGDLLGELFSEDDPWAGGGYIGDGGGFGTYPTDDAMIQDTDASQFAIDAINSGFITLYRPTKASVIALNNFLFSGITDAMSITLKKLISNPLDYILFIAMAHFTPTTGASGEIKYCGIPTGVYSEIISNQYHKIDCGWLNVVEPSRSFLDYNPNTKIKIYLPYIGIQELNTDDCMGGRIHVTYWIDLLTGSCIAQVRCQRNARTKTDVTINDVLYEYTGNCYVTLPLTATDWRGAFNSMLQFVGSAVGAASGNFGGLGSMASSVIAEKVSASRSGQAGTSYGYMGHQKPYLIYERPINSLPNSFKSKRGYISNISAKLSTVAGFTQIDSNSLYFNNSKCSDKEITELKQMLESGVYI